MNASYTELRFCLSEEVCALASERLVGVGFFAFAIEDHVLTAWLPPDQSATQDIQRIEQVVGSVATQRRLDHAEIYAGVVPSGSWEVAPSWWVISGDGQAPAGAGQVVRMPNGGGFGDGRHPATCLAASLLVSLDLRGLRVLDVGCGTGLLGIIAAKSGALSVTLADIDADSVRHAQACVVDNQVQCAVYRSDLLADLPQEVWDLVVANLYGEFLVAMFQDPRLLGMLPQGRIVLSGISDAKRGMVEDGLSSNGFVVLERRTTEGWWGLLALRQGV